MAGGRNRSARGSNSRNTGVNRSGTTSSGYDERGRDRRRAGAAFIGASTFRSVNTTAAEHPVRARLGRWPDDADVAHLVLLDHHMVPDRDHVESWLADARALGVATLRTGALFPPSAPAFLAAGFEVIDTLSLLELDLLERVGDHERSAARLRRLRPSQLDEAAIVDRDAFRGALGERRSRVARHRHGHADIAPGASGTAGAWWRSRSAVERRRGATFSAWRSSPPPDGEGWPDSSSPTRSTGCTDATSSECSSTPQPTTPRALALYRSLGFVERPERLTILERSLR